ncbi:MAG: hypothetical protein Q9160_007404 [Pyrenula sp. 1 TL-2023]
MIPTVTELADVAHLRQQRHESDASDIPITDLRAGNSADAVGDDQAPVDAVEAVPDGGYGWTVVSACALLLFWMNGYSTTWGVLQTALLQSSSLKVDIRTITFVGSLAMAFIVAFGLVSVRLMNTFGLRYTCLTAAILLGLGPILTSFTLDNIGGLFCTAGVLVGSSSSILYTATNSLPIQWFSSKLGLANGLVKAGGGVGATVLPIAAQALIDSVGLPWAFRTFGFLMLATGIPTALMLKERVPAAQSSRFDWSLLKNIPFLTLAMAGAVGVFALFVPPFFLPLFARSIGLSASTGAALVAGFGGSTALGRLFSGWLCDRIGAFNTLAITVLINSISMLAIWPVSASLPPLLIFAVVNGCANGSFFTALPTAVAALAPGSAASSISLAISFWTPGYLLGSPIAGMLIQATGAAESESIKPYRAAIFYAAGTGLLATFLVVFSRMRLDTKLIKKL